MKPQQLSAANPRQAGTGQGEKRESKNATADSTDLHRFRRLALLRFGQRYGLESHFAHQRGEARVCAHDVERGIWIHPTGWLVILIQTFLQPVERCIDLS